MNIINDALTELNRIFQILNVEKFDGVLPEPIITIQFVKNTFGHFTTKKIWKNKNLDINSEDDSFYEININPNGFLRSPEEIVATLLHEMVHYYNQIQNINDCNGNVHNKKFKTLAENVGLKVEKNKKYGWGVTYCSDSLKDYIKNTIQPNQSVFKYFRYIPPKEQKKRKKTIFKYTCPYCGLEIKGKEKLNVKCGLCNINLEMENPEGESDG